MYKYETHITSFCYLCCKFNQFWQKNKYLDRMNKWLTFIDFLSERINFGLPGIDAQLLMAPVHRISDIRSGLRRNESVKSSVLILLYPEQELIKTVVILRPFYDGVHSGQISLPGGKWEPNDADMSCTALRETYEEIGVDPSEIRLLGQLSPLYIPPSNYIVFPYIGITDNKPEFLKDPLEVQEIIEINIAELWKQDARATRQISFKDNTAYEVPCYIFGDTIIWGATAMILSEFKVLLDNIHLSEIFNQPNEQ
jgi:8-oxo-dGTP pyrophosphatase MutT (NUDIX family)